MAVLTPEEIFGYALQAGFTPDQAVTMTAIALAESSGRTEAHNTSGEDSVGLWQINRDAHGSAPWMQGLDMSNPAHQAIAAFHVSGGGADISPWTVTHQSRSSPYLQHLDAARATAQGLGYADAMGNADPPTGYGDPTPASSDGSVQPVEVTPPLDTAPAEAVAFDPAAVDAGQGDPALVTYLRAALSQSGDSYVFGAETRLDDADPTQFDCSELVEWSLARAGVSFVDGSHNQSSLTERAGTHISVEEAMATPGALLFRFSPNGGHVAISLGNGTTIEAKGRAYGVGTFEAEGRFQHGALVPGLDYESIRGLSIEQIVGGQPGAMAGGDFGDPEVGPAPSPQLAYAAEHAGSDDRDQDMIADHFEAKYNLDPDNPDSDGDGITDGYELINLKTDALAADSDFDAMSDAAELEAGTNPNMPDNPDAPAALTDEALSDVDGDGIGSLGERLAGTDPRSADSDSDLLADGDEIQLGSDPLDPTSTALVGGVAGDDPLAAVGTDLGGDGMEPAADAVEGG